MRTAIDNAQLAQRASKRTPPVRPALAGSILLFLVTFTVYAYHSRYIGVGDTIPNELLPISIILERNLDFNEFLCRYNPHFSPDLEKHDTVKSYHYFSVLCDNALPYYFKEINGRVVSFYPILPGILNTFVYFVFYLFGTNLLQNIGTLSLLSSSLISSLSVVFMFLCLRRACRSDWLSFAFSLLYAFGTLVWSVTSRGIWQHGPSLLFISITLFVLYTRGERRLPLSGLFLGLAVAARPTNILIALPLTVYVFLHHRRVFFRYCLFASIPALLLVSYSYFYMGSLSSLGQGHGLQGFDGQFAQGFLGLLISPARGLFVFSPVFLFAAMSIPRALSSWEPIDKYLIASLLLLVGIYSKWGMWWGGHTFGYRLLLETLPALTILLTKCWQEILSKRRWLSCLFLASVGVSVFFNFLGAQFYPCGFNYLPDDIDLNTSRLWLVADTELVRCARVLGEPGRLAFTLSYFAKRALLLLFGLLIARHYFTKSPRFPSDPSAEAGPRLANSNSCRDAGLSG